MAPAHPHATGVAVYPALVFSCGHATLQEALSVGPSVHPSVGLSVRPSVRWSVMIESMSGKTSVLDTFCLRMSVGGGLGCGWGLDAPAHPSATIL